MQLLNYIIFISKFIGVLSFDQILKKKVRLKELFFLKNFQSKDEIRITIQFIDFYFQISNANKNENILFKIKYNDKKKHG
jgi:hypothetical protein